MARGTKAAALLLLLLPLAGCTPGDGACTPDRPARFLSGIWHGWIAPFSLVLGLVNGGKTRIYETANAGWGYDFGYYMAIISGFGGLALLRRRRGKEAR